MTVLAVNVGSSSIKLALFDRDLGHIKKRVYKAGQRPTECLEDFMKDSGNLGVRLVTHRVVHGGSLYSESTIIDEEVEAGIEDLFILAPIHNKRALEWIRACGKKFKTDQVAVFDTSFFSGLPDLAKTYALPRRLSKEKKIRRYGFHGIAHSAMLASWRELRPDLEAGGRVITLQLGAGCSAAAIKSGGVLDTSMGFTPLEGLVMSTRSGDIDPGILLYLQRIEGFTLDELDNLLNRESGLFGLSETSGDMKRLLESGSKNALFAVDMFCSRVRKYIGAFAAVLGGLDGIVFGGGIGENSPYVRERIIQGMEWMGITIDKKLNTGLDKEDGIVSGEDSRVTLYVVNVDEELILAKEGMRIMSGQTKGRRYSSG